MWVGFFNPLVLPWEISREKQMPPDCILLLQLLFTKSQETQLVIPWEDWRRGTLTVRHDRPSPTGPPLLRLETLSALRQNAVTLS